MWLGNSQTFGEIIVTNGGKLYLDANEESRLFSCETIDIYAGSRVVFLGDREQINEESGGVAGTPHGRGAILRGKKIRVHTGGAIDADMLGFPILGGPGAGAGGANNNGGRGAGYGGVGGDGKDVTLRTGGATYGTNIWPTALGSGGGRNVFSRPGGGAITLIAEDELVADGVITSNGGVPSSGSGSGASGGSILIVAGDVTGDGTITARGANVGGNPSAGGGGGGKITVLYGETALKRDKVLAGRLDLVRMVDGLADFEGEVTAAAGVGYTGGEQQAEDGVVVFLQVIPAGGTVLVIR
jgi:hypothetical protein